MKTRKIILSLIIISTVPLSVSALDGKVFGDGYVGDSVVFEEPGYFVSDSFRYSRENRLSINGSFGNITVRVQTSSSNFSNIEENRELKFTGPGSKKFDSMDKGVARYVILMDNPGRVDSITLSTVRDYSLFIYMGASIIIFIVVGSVITFVISRI